METIIKHLPPASRRQTLLFSATLTDVRRWQAGRWEHLLTIFEQSLYQLQKLTSNAAVYCDCTSEATQTVKTLDQKYLFIPQAVKEVGKDLA